MFLMRNPRCFGSSVWFKFYGRSLQGGVEIHLSLSEQQRASVEF